MSYEYGNFPPERMPAQETREMKLKYPSMAKDAAEAWAKRAIRLEQTKCCYCIPVRTAVMIITFFTVLHGISVLLEVSGVYTVLFAMNTTAAKVLYGLFGIGEVTEPRNGREYAAS